MHVNFRIRNSRTSKLKGTLYCRVTIDGVRGPEKSTFITINKKDWDSSKQTIRNNTNEATSLNSRLTDIKSAVNQAFIILAENANSHSVIEYVFSSKVARLRLLDMHLKFIELKRSTTNNSPATFKKYERYLANILQYFIEIKRSNPYLDCITENDYIQFLIWAKKNFNSKDYIAKNAQYFRTLLGLAASRGLIKGNPGEYVRVHRGDSYDTTHLSITEVEQLATFNFKDLGLKASTIKVLEEERDAFVFCCFTGMHHIDYTSKEYKLVSINNRNWLVGYRVKSAEGKRDKLYEFPLHPIAQNIIKRYGSIDLLPIRDNSSRNARLKTIAGYCGIKICLSTKIARKTMANWCLNTMRMRQETVAAVLGLKSTKYLRHYVQITSESIDAEMVFMS